MANSRRPQHTFKATPFRARSTRAYLRSARCVGSATKPTSNSWHRSPVWFAEEVPLTPIICGSPNPARWGSRSATSSRCRCAEFITVTSIAMETNSPGGNGGRSIPSRLPGCFGSRRGASGEYDTSIRSLRALNIQRARMFVSFGSMCRLYEPLCARRSDARLLR